jgi:HAMP domain-containing protein
VLDYLSHYTHGLTGKMVLTFAGIVAAFGLMTIALVYFTLTSSLSKHVIQRASVTAVNVSDGAPAFLLKNNATGLRELLRKHANRPHLAYILVENRAGEIFAHSFAVLPQEVQGRSSLGDRPPDSRRLLRLGENSVEEVSVPILEGRGGAVRVGIWRAHVDAEINETVIPLIKLLGFVVGGGILVAVFLAWRINRPIFRLVAAAKAISSGDLDVPAPRVEDASEFGELSRAIERMRSSVKAAMIRLSQ